MNKAENPYAMSMRLSDPSQCVKDAALMRKFSQKINDCMTRMFQKPENGGNPYLYAVAMSKPHVMLSELEGIKGWETAATNGKMFFWHPNFLDKIDVFETMVVMCHEVLHDQLYHVGRGYGREYPRIWNWAIDYVVNAIIWEDHDRTQRGSKIGRAKLWEGNLGSPLSLKELLDYLDGGSELPESDKGMIFADKSLYGRSPDSIYDEIVKHYMKSPRRCPQCGALNMDPKTGKPKKNKGQGQQGKKQDQQQGKDPGQGGQGQQQGQQQGGQGQQPGQGQGGQGHQHGNHQHGNGDDTCKCPGCGNEMDPLSSMDAHIKSKSTKEDIQSEMMRAAERCKGMPPGSIPSVIQDKLNELMKPQLKFRDIVRNCMMRKSSEAGLKNDWTRCRKRYLAASPSQYLPKRYTHKPRWVAMIDTSGSMTDDDIAYGISQLQILGNNTDGYLVPCDAEVKWDSVTKIGNKNDLKKTKIVGRGGTIFDTFFKGLPEHLGTDFDVVVVLTDGDCPMPPKNLRPPSDVVWVLTNGRHRDFKPSFGRVAPLRDDRM